MSVRTVSRRGFLGLSAAAATSAILAACAPQATPAPKEVIKEVVVEKTVEVPVTATPAPEGPIEMEAWVRDASDEAIIAVTDMWNQANPLIQVKIVPTPGGGQTVPEKLITAIVSGSAPPIAHIDMFTCPSWAARGAWEDLTPLLEAEGANVADEFFPWAVDETSYLGRVFGMTQFTGHDAFVWSKNLFEEVGLDPEVPPKSAEELLQFAEKLDKKEGGKYARLGFDPMSTVLPWALGYFWLGCKTSPVADFYDFSQMKCTCNHPRIVEALEWKVEWCQRYGPAEVDSFRSVFDWGEQDPMGQGLVAMQEAGNWMHDMYGEYFPDMKWGAAPMPIPAKYGGTSPASCMGSEGFTLTRGVKSPYREAAYKYVRFMTGKEGMLEYCKQIDMIPTRKDLIDDPYFRRTPMYSAWMDLLPCGFNRPAIAEAELLWTELNAADDKAIHGQGKPKELLDEVAQKVDEAMQKWLVE